jgi:hypothetical protein
MKRRHFLLQKAPGFPGAFMLVPMGHGTGAVAARRQYWRQKIWYASPAGPMNAG